MRKRGVWKRMKKGAYYGRGRRIMGEEEVNYYGKWERIKEEGSVLWKNRKRRGGRGERIMEEVLERDVLWKRRTTYGRREHLYR